jgi:universal stress protein A
VNYIERKVEMPRFNKIVCPVDFDQTLLPALRIAAHLALEHNATLYLLHVIKILPGPEVALAFGEMETAARTRLERISHQNLQPETRYELLVRMGDPAVEVLQLASQLGADLIVMATHGRKGLRRLVLGSVAEHVVREAPCPVLTVRPKTARAARSSRTETRRPKRA